MARRAYPASLKAVTKDLSEPLTPDAQGFTLSMDASARLPSVGSSRSVRIAYRFKTTGQAANGKRAVRHGRNSRHSRRISARRRRRSNAWGWRSGSIFASKPRSPSVLIGRDTRESGPHIAECIARGLAAAGSEPVSAGVLTTPGVAWLVNRDGFSAGVVISASHNPYHDNGVKLISSSGMKFPDSVEAALEHVILSKNGNVSA